MESGKASLPFIVVRGTLWPLDSVLPGSPAGPAIPAAQTDGMNDTGSGRPACPTPIPNRPIGDPSRQSPLGTKRRPCKFVVWCACPAGVVRRTERVQVTVISGDTGCGKTTQCPQVRTAGGCFEHTRRNARRPLASPRPPFSPSTLAILPLTLFSLPRPLLHPYLAARCRLHFVVLMCVAVHPRRRDPLGRRSHLSDHLHSAPPHLGCR